MNEKLSKIAEISTGFSFRGPVPFHEDGDMLVIQASDVLEDYTIKTDDLKSIKLFNASIRVVVDSGDIVLVSRSMDTGGFRAAVVGSVDKTVIASSTLHIIRSMKDKVVPEFLCTYLNSDKGRSDLLRISTGSSIRMISLKELGNLTIPLPDLNEQIDIARITKNIQKQKFLSKKRDSLLDKIHSSAIQQITR